MKRGRLLPVFNLREKKKKEYTETGRERRPVLLRLLGSQSKRSYWGGKRAWEGEPIKLSRFKKGGGPYQVTNLELTLRPLISYLSNNEEERAHRRLGVFFGTLSTY